MDRSVLLSKLAAVEALEDAPGSEGERRAAARARHRLEARLADLEAARLEYFADEMTLANHLRSFRPAAARARADVGVPTRAEVSRRLAAALRGGASLAGISRWAATIVDRVVLPDLPVDDPASVVPEVLLVLAGAPTNRRLGELALHFLASSPEETGAAWGRWMEGLAALG